MSIASSASAVPPEDIPFNDPVKTWSSEYWDVTELKAAWATTLGSDRVTVAVVDSGVKPLNDLVPVMSGYNSWGGSKNTSDESGHGTMMASIIAARANNGIGVIGVCPLCSIMSVRAFSPPYRMGKNKRLYWDVTYDSLARGIKWAANHGAKVINVAFSSAEGDRSLKFNKAVAYATYKKRALVVIAAGNGTYDGKKNDEKGTNNPGANYLAADNPEALRVGAAERPDPNSPLQLSPVSNFGKWVDVSAWGYQLPVDSLEYPETPTGVTGTSPASAVVAGVAGSVWSKYPKLTQAQLKAIIMSSCDDSVPDVRCGGVASANRALIAAQNPPKSVYLRVKIGGVGKVALSGQAACTTANCRYNLVAGMLKLRATPTKANWQFDHWTGGISSKKATLSINMKAAKNIKAVFVRIKIEEIW